ncbi:hypothetical protein RI367_001313 [Sorochytrium milnesiophthora]
MDTEISDIQLKPAPLPANVLDYNFIAKSAEEALAEARAKYRREGQRSPLEKANIFSRIWFSWNTNLMRRGYSHPLQEEDLYPLGFHFSAVALSNKFKREWHRELMRVEEFNTRPVRSKRLPLIDRIFNMKSKKTADVIDNVEYPLLEPNMVRVLFHSIGHQWALAGLLKFIGDMCSVAVPVVIRNVVAALVAFQNDDPNTTLGSAIGLVVGMFVLQLVASLCNNAYMQLSMVTGLKARTVIITAAFEKSLKLSSTARQTWNSGKVVNVIATDTYRLDMVMPYLHMIWACPIQVLVAAILLIIYMGPTALVGVAILAVFVPVQAKAMAFVTTVRRASQLMTDKRVKLVNELLQGMKIVKFLAWETPMYDRIADTRAKEIKLAARAAVMKSAIVGIAISIPSIATILVFILYAVTVGKLTPPIVTVGLSLLNLVRMPLWQFPQALAYGLDAWVSSQRITGLLTAEELQSQPEFVQDASAAIAINHADLVWETEPTAPAPGKPAVKAGDNGANDEDSANVSEHHADYRLNGVNLTIPKGKLVAIVGKVGSGKSSLLNGIVGEMKRVTGSVVLNGTLGYCPQVPWIQNATVRENVLFGLPYNSERYANAIRLSALQRDFELLPDGDKTEIGEKGINLSGGQKARINLARSLYAQPDIYLFDDVLSAVDAHVGAFIFNECIRKSLRGKTCVLVTHALSYVSQCDIVVFMQNGVIAETGTFDECMRRGGEFADLMHTHAGIENQEKPTSVLSAATSHISVLPPPTEDIVDMKPDLQIEFNGIDQVALTGETIEDHIADNQEAPRKLMIAEERAVGAVGWHYYYVYIAYCGGWAPVSFTLFLIGMSQVVRVLNDMWLTWWSETALPLTQAQIIGIYVGWGLLQSVLTMWSNIQFVYAGVRGSQRLHNAALNRIMRAPLSFFDQTPLGRIMSRFSKDVDVTDNILYDLFRMFFRSFSMSLSIIVVMCISTPILIAPLVVLIIFYLVVQMFYRTSVRELKRLESITRSPLYAQLGEALTGIVTIRSFGATDRFMELNKTLMDVNNTPYFLQITAQRWLGVRLELIANLLTVLSATFGLVGRHTISPALVGLSLSYALQITMILNNCVFQGAEAESQMNTVERLDYYAQEIPNEKPAVVPDAQVPENWPSTATIQFDQLNLSYRPDDGVPPVLKDFTLRIPGGSRVGIVGRTGAGKSTIISALLRLVEPLSGTAFIDGVDMTKIGLYTLRSAIAIIPQDPVLFEGTIRSNLDRFQRFDDAHLWRCLQSAGLHEMVQALDKKLDAPVLENGENFSLGERCCLCLARAMTGKQRVLIMDEATASVDLETETVIQQSIRRDFDGVTVLTIAHRLNTVIDYDFILVLDAGRIAEFGHPADLLDNPTSELSRLVDETGPANSALLRHIALDAKANGRHFE